MTDAPRRRPSSRWWPGMLIGLLVFGFGFVAGGGVAVVTVGKRLQSAIRQPDLMPGRLAQRLQRRYDLDDDQRARLEAAVRDFQRSQMAMRRRMRMQLGPDWRALRDEIKAILGPEHAGAFESRFDDLRRSLGTGVDPELDGSGDPAGEEPPPER